MEVISLFSLKFLLSLSEDIDSNPGSVPNEIQGQVEDEDLDLDFNARTSDIN